MALDVDSVLADLTLEEKAALSIGSDMWHTAAVERLGLESIMVSDGPHGLRAQFEHGDHVGIGDSVPATCFPTASALASSWNPELLYEVGQALARECLHWGVSVLLGPGVNMKRSPLCGRNFEYFSEDPYQAGVLAGAMVRGVQSLGIGTSLKHFAVNNQETDRMRVSAEVDERTLREIYLPAFERVVTEAKPWTVMCSYNKINNVYASQDHWLLTELLRQEWGFDGLVVSDWGAVHDRVAALRAGLDLEMPPKIGYSDTAVVEAVRSGELDESVLEDTVRRLLDLVDRTRPAREDQQGFDADEHHRLARRAAAESAVLLKNDDQLLPLAADSKINILVVGEFAWQPRFQGAGSSQVNPTRIDLPLEELRTLAGPEVVINFVPGYGLEDGGDDATLQDEAIAAAAEADVVLAFLGLPAAAESEGFDRTDIDLPASQRDLLAALAGANSRIAVLLANGAAVSVSDWQQHATAILECWLGGQAAGGAVADLIFGRANPSGKLAETIPDRLQDNPSYLNFPGGQGIVRYGEGVFIGYRGYDKAELEVAYPFGHGLSYTSFAVSDLDVTVGGSVADGDLEVVARATVRNTGDRDGAEVVQLYVADPASTVPRPMRELKGFAKINLAPGESGEVEFRLEQRAFAFWSERLHRWAVEAGDFEIAVGSSSRELTQKQTITLDAPSIDGPLGSESTLDEWLSDARGRGLLEADPKVGPILQQLDGPMRQMIGQMPMSTLAGFGMFGVGLADLDRAVAQLSAESAR
ncbi:beta-glucosidase [Microlunatus elymi]|uniref:Exo-alpha-(1->6)-L-arabinopyranosidase n=1 Tax=Microlunatus elymi TaxID=2596828 RepID=A0A516PTZ6_9ACTN|nr:glycoside hydrolase family 3 C-terminal domain-containing protein [Microlunatus elymi]QDP94676.1 beta-glucosidase [Microlunatus elymi]